MTTVIQKKSERQLGLTLLEVMVAVVILTFVALAMMSGFGVTRKHSSMINHRAFAVQKVTQMMQEIKSMRLSQDLNAIDDLHDDDYNYVLTLRSLSGWSGSYLSESFITDPGDILSGNPNKVYVRRVLIENIPNDRTMRKVYVAVYLDDTKKLLAEAANLFSTIEDVNRPLQVFHVFALGIGNIPTWRVNPYYAKFLSLGLSWSKVISTDHWLDIKHVKNLGYGRDPFYTPYTNDMVTTESQNASDMKVYYYPGCLANCSGADPSGYYFNENFDGELLKDGTVQVPYSFFVWAYPNENSPGASLPDQYNHLVRYPREEVLYDLAVQNATLVKPFWSLRMLIEKMYTNPEMVKNALVLNLHGDVVPMPPMRNFSDAAKDPAGRPNMRAVTHSEKISYGSGEDVKLRVYTYVMDPDNAAWDDQAVPPISVTIEGLHEFADISIRRVYRVTAGKNFFWGGAARNFNPSGVGYSHVKVPSQNYTVLALYNSSMTFAPGSNGSGLNSDDRLYDLEYIPAPLAGAGSDFDEGTRDLMDTSDDPKNTAVWVITISGMSDGQAEIVTRLGTDLTTGFPGNQPANISRTYVWVETNVPVTEQYQFLGDPRHMPYSDVKSGHGYNMFFTAVNAADYPGYSLAQGPWDGRVNVDVPRYFQVLRKGLMNAGIIWGNLPKEPFSHVALGGEIGDPLNALNIKLAPWDKSGANAATVDTINEMTDDATLANEIYTRLIARVNDDWYGRYWIGELYPDDKYDVWSVDGNLPVKPSEFVTLQNPPQFFYRASFQLAGLDKPHKTLGQKGLASFFNGSDTGAADRYFSYDTTNCNAGDCSIGVLTSTGTATTHTFADFPLKGPEVADATRPFGSITDAALKPPEWDLGDYPGLRTTVSKWETYYEPKNGFLNLDSAAALRVSPVGSSTMAATVVLTTIPEPDDRFVQVTWSMMLRAFMSTGWPITDSNTSQEDPRRTAQNPYIAISTPSHNYTYDNPTNIEIDWKSLWRRWDGNAYTSVYPLNFEDTYSTLKFTLQYAREENGNEVFYWANPISSPPEIVLGTDADTSAHSMALTPDGYGVYQYNLGVSDDTLFPPGDYTLRVNTYVNGRLIHFSFHDRQFNIKRLSN